LASRIVATMQSTEIDNRKGFSFPWKITLILYGLSFLPSLLSMNSRYWDDWTMFDLQTGELLTSQYSGGGNAPWRGWIEPYLFQSSLPIFRIVSLIIYFLIGYFLFHILKRSQILISQQIVVITILFLVVPVNSARISIVCSKYGVAAFFFFLGWYLYETKNHRVAVFLGYVFFFLSYSELPFPTFTLLPILYHIALRKPTNVRACLREIIYTTPLILLPLIYLVIRQIFWPVTGSLAVTYRPQLLGTVRAFLFIGICSIPLALHLASYKFGRLKRPALLVSVGCFCVSIAAFPYMLGGHLVDISDWLIAFVPNFSDWHSRHQLLLPLGFALIIAGSFRFLPNTELRWNSHPVLSCLIASFVALNFTFAQEYFLDGKKQESILAEMVKNEDLKNSKFILVDDSAIRFNARGRLIRSYEWEAMLEKVFGDDTRKVTYLQYVNCDEFQPDAILHISAPNGRLESTIRRRVDIDLRVEKINPCGI
jgi:hypothetical protein